MKMTYVGLYLYLISGTLITGLKRRIYIRMYRYICVNIYEKVKKDVRRNALLTLCSTWFEPPPFQPISSERNPSGFISSFPGNHDVSS